MATEFDLTAPDGTPVTVTDKGRRDVLLARGYAEGHAHAVTPGKPAKGAKRAGAHLDEEFRQPAPSVSAASRAKPEPKG